ncbi:MAG: class I SAM-dependent methyltransferase [Gammaproteobacteria bacterium]|nr:class I SAM-dependent methyltransferase [Gammaproteobacteria bacterium]
MTEGPAADDSQSALREIWQERANDHGAQLGSVLLARLPELANQAIDHWHQWIIQREVLPCLPHGASILDLGCGYGRLSKSIQQMRADVVLTGLDFAPAFCALYEQQVGRPAVCASAAAPPFPAASFDAVLAVTVLMYLPTDECHAAVERLLALLKPGGVILVVDPGAEYLAAARKAGGRATATGGDGFTLERFHALAGDQAFKSGAMPWLSAVLPMTLWLRRWHLTSKLLLDLAGWLDRHLPVHKRYSLHRYLVLRSAGDGVGG